MINICEFAVFGGGCFWCTEAVFCDLKGVSAVMPGYAGGDKNHATYAEVSSGTTGHAEVIMIEYDPAAITFHDLLTVFFATHDPTTPNRQGADNGPQYRSLILFTTTIQQKAATAFLGDLMRSGVQAVTEVKPLGIFTAAEAHHREYYKNNPSAPYCQIVINPKLEKVRDKFHELLDKSQSKTA